MVTDGVLKLNYASVIFVDRGVQIDETYNLILLPQSLVSGVIGGDFLGSYCIMCLSGGSYHSTTISQSTQNTSSQPLWLMSSQAHLVITTYTHFIPELHAN